VLARSKLGLHVQARGRDLAYERLIWADEVAALGGLETARGERTRGPRIYRWQSERFFFREAPPVCTFRRSRNGNHSTESTEVPFNQFHQISRALPYSLCVPRFTNPPSSIAVLVSGRPHVVNVASRGQWLSDTVYRIPRYRQKSPVRNDPDSSRMQAKSSTVL